VFLPDLFAALMEINRGLGITVVLFLGNIAQKVSINLVAPLTWSVMLVPKALPK
jgi:hypothetical protein